MEKITSNIVISLIVMLSLSTLVYLFSPLVKVQAASKSEKAIAAQSSNAGKGQQMAETHRSAVATFVQSLVSVADREKGGIGEQVRVIAQQQNVSGFEVSEEITAVESRGKIKTFLIGSDYKNLGALRSEMVQTRNRIGQLQRLVDKATTEEDKTILQDQITKLEKERTDINKFITDNENKFSLFGWFVKLFTK
jgi:hypothetical protein